MKRFPADADDAGLECVQWQVPTASLLWVQRPAMEERV